MPKLWALGTTPAHKAACRLLKASYSITDSLEPDIAGVLLDVPSFRSPLLTPEALLSQLPAGTAIIGGNLTPVKDKGHPLLDLLADPEYAAKNADITARCAIRLACGRLEQTLDALPVLVIGWGRIGKCLAKHLRALDAQVTVYARQPKDRAMLAALGYRVLPDVPENCDLTHFRLIFNTAPAPMLSEEKTTALDSCLLFNLASTPGMAGERVITARGLPGLLAPESSGQLIAQTVQKLWKEEML